MIALSPRRAQIAGTISLVLTSLSFSAAAEEGVLEAPQASELDEGGAKVSFSGLRVYKDGSATMRVNLTERTQVAESTEGTTVTFLLQGASVELKNNKFPLRAEYFGSNVTQTRLRDSDEGVKVEIQLRKSVPLEHQFISHAGGVILRIDIPPAK